MTAEGAAAPREAWEHEPESTGETMEPRAFLALLEVATPRTWPGMFLARELLEDGHDPSTWAGTEEEIEELIRRHDRRAAKAPGMGSGRQTKKAHPGRTG